MENKKCKFSIGNLFATSSVPYTIISIIIGFLIGALMLAIAGLNPIESYGILWDKIMGTPKARAYSFMEFATPYILTGLSVAFSFRTGIFNIGAEGQFIMGGLAALVVGVFVKAPSFILIPLCLLAAMAAAALWGAIVGYLKVKIGANEVLCMIMFNWIAFYFSNFIVTSKFINAGSGKTWSVPIQDEAKITIKAWTDTLSPHVNAGFFMAIAAVIIVYIIINHTTLGYRLRAVGFNKNAAEYAGINVNRSVLTALSISGALAGLAGAIQVMGVNYKITEFAAQESYGFQGITVAMIGATHPIGTFFAGLFYGAMKFGGSRFGAPSEVVDVMMGIIVICIAISSLFRMLVKNRKGGKK